MNQALLYPVFVMVLLTAIVWLRMGLGRVQYLKQQRIHPQKVATRPEAGEVFAPICKTADHFANLFEVPVLFYLLVVLLLITGKADGGYVGLAWLFVLGRLAHAWIHCTYNKVRHRFLAFLLSTLVLWVMWGRFAVQSVLQA